METEKTVDWLNESEAILISASNGLSISEGYHIFADNDDFKKYFGYFRDKYGIDCLIRGVFAEIPEHDRYMKTVHKYLIEDYNGSEVMKNLQKIISGKEYFIVTSNADTHFQINNFDTGRIFEVEGNFDGTAMYGDEWRKQRENFERFTQQNRDKNTVVLELGIGRQNQLIKKPLMDMVEAFAEWKYVTLNMPDEIYIPESIKERSVALPGDISKTFESILEKKGD